MVSHIQNMLSNLIIPISVLRYWICCFSLCCSLWTNFCCTSFDCPPLTSACSLLIFLSAFLWIAPCSFACLFLATTLLFPFFLLTPLSIRLSISPLTCLWSGPAVYRTTGRSFSLAAFRSACIYPPTCSLTCPSTCPFSRIYLCGLRGNRICGGGANGFFDGKSAWESIEGSCTCWPYFLSYPVPMSISITLVALIGFLWSTRFSCIAPWNYCLSL